MLLVSLALFFGVSTLLTLLGILVAPAGMQDAHGFHLVFEPEQTNAAPRKMARATAQHCPSKRKAIVWLP